MVVAKHIDRGMGRCRGGRGEPFAAFARIADCRDDRDALELNDMPVVVQKTLMLARARRVLPEARSRVGDKMRSGLLTLWKRLESLWQAFAALLRRADRAAATEALSATRAREAQLPPASLSSLVDINLSARLLPLPFVSRA